MIFSIERFTAANGIRLRYGFTRPAQVRAYVLILQGLGEFIECYEETARELATRNLGCVAFDFRGQGGSGRVMARRNICHIGDLDEYCVDTREVMEHLRQRLGIETDLLLTHSTGGLVGMKMLVADPGTWRSAVMIAPFFGLGGPDWLTFTARFLARGLGRLGFARCHLPRPGNFSAVPLPRFVARDRQGRAPACSLRPSFHPNNPWTSDDRRYTRNIDYLVRNPRLNIRGISLGWLDACFRAQTALATEAETLAVDALLPPITMVLAGEERIVDNRKTEAMFSANPRVTITAIPAARHELLQERDCFRRQFWAAFDRHIDRFHLR